MLQGRLLHITPESLHGARHCLRSTSTGGFAHSQTTPYHLGHHNESVIVLCCIASNTSVLRHIRQPGGGMVAGSLGGFRRHGGMAAQALHDASGVEGVAAPRYWGPPRPQTSHPAATPTAAKVATLLSILTAVASRLIHPVPQGFIIRCAFIRANATRHCVDVIWVASPCFKGGSSTVCRSHGA